MCLIIYAKSARPAERHLLNAFSHHPHGIGMAWKADGKLNFTKDLKLEEVISLNATMPPGYVIHFRKSSIGGVNKDLIHPFIVSNQSPLRQSGEAKALLFHNGHWPDWERVMLNHLNKSTLLPKGVWSDSRAIAILLAIHGPDILRLLPGRFVLAKEDQISLWGDWVEEKTKGGVCYFSNDTFRWSSNPIWSSYGKTSSDGLVLNESW